MIGWFTAARRALLPVLLVIALGWVCVLAVKGWALEQRLQLAQQREQAVRNRADAAEAAFALSEQHRSEEARIRNAQQEAIDHAQDQIEAAQRDAAAARDSARSLRAAADAAATAALGGTGWPRDTSLAQGSDAAASPAHVLADVLGRADDAAGLLAEALDRAHIAGQACQRAYQALTPSTEP